jgi:hypothetical protein
MYASWITCLAEVVALKCRWTCDNLCFEAVEGFLSDDIAYRKDILDIKKEKAVLRQGEEKKEAGQEGKRRRKDYQGAVNSGGIPTI